MEFNLQRSIEILQRTPRVMESLLGGLPDEWIYCNEGPDTWTAFDVIGHLIECEETNFIVRAVLIITEGEKKPFSLINMTAQFEKSKGKTIRDLLHEFADLRRKNISTLHSMQITDRDLMKTGLHPRSGRIKLSEVLATWVAHDLSHLVQVSRIMAKQYSSAVGPFREYLRILK